MKQASGRVMTLPTFVTNPLRGLEARVVCCCLGLLLRVVPGSGGLMRDVRIRREAAVEQIRGP